MRDLLADLKFCDRATQGPWRHEWKSYCSEVYAPGVDTPIVLVGHDPYDADFIVQAREGWPHAIERAIEAEALVQELVELLKEANDLIGLASYLISDGSMYSEDYGEFLTRCDTLDFRMKEVMGDDKVHAGRQSKGEEDH